MLKRTKNVFIELVAPVKRALAQFRSREPQIGKQQHKGAICVQIAKLIRLLRRPKRPDSCPLS